MGIQDRKRKKKLSRRRKRLYIKLGIYAGLLIAVLCIVIAIVGRIKNSIEEKKAEEQKPPTLEEMMEQKAEENGFSVSEYTFDIKELMRKNPEALEFTLNYPLKKDSWQNDPITEYETAEEIPLLIQWDDKWGYYPYAGKNIGIAGCGPTSLSMVAGTLLHNPELTPIYMADFATERGYSLDGGGTTWDLMNEGAKALGLNPKEVPLDENAIKKHLENGRPIIVNVGEGIFTEHGHYMVFVGWEDGKIRINDPNRREYSERLWSYDEIQDQIRNMWVY